MLSGRVGNKVKWKIVFFDAYERMDYLFTMFIRMKSFIHLLILLVIPAVVLSERPVPVVLDPVLGWMRARRVEHVHHVGVLVAFACANSLRRSR